MSNFCVYIFIYKTQSVLGVFDQKIIDFFDIFIGPKILTTILRIPAFSKNQQVYEKPNKEKSNVSTKLCLSICL